MYGLVEMRVYKPYTSVSQIHIECMVVKRESFNCPVSAQHDVNDSLCFHRH